MNNEINEQELENLLRGLAPAAASPALVQRVDDELKLDMSWLSTSRPKPRQQPRWLMSAGWAAMGAAAAFAVMSYLPTQHAEGGAAALATAPATIREWDDEHGNSLHRGRSLNDDKLALVVSRELGTWVDPRYSSQMTVDISSRQQLLQPVSFR